MSGRALSRQGLHDHGLTRTLTDLRRSGTAAQRFSIVGVNQAAEDWLGAEVEEHSNLDGAATQVVEELGLVSGVNGLRDLDLNDHAHGYQQIRFERSYSRSVKEHIKRGFPKVGDTALVQGNREGVSIYRFEESSSELTMDNEE